MYFLFKVVTSCSRIPKAKPSFNRQTGCRKGDSYLALLLLHFLVYFILAVLSLTKKQVLSLILLESSSFNHPPNVYEENLLIGLLRAACMLSDSSRTVSTDSARSSWPGARAAPPGWWSGCFRGSLFLLQAPGSISSRSFGWKVTPPGWHFPMPQASIQCPHLPSGVWALWDLDVVALVTLLTP